MENTKHTDRAKGHFKRWKKMVGLDERFPNLKEILEEDLLQKTYVREDDLETIETMIGYPRVAIIINRGYGCTTLARYVYTKTLSDSLKRRIIPINIDLVGFWESKDLVLDLEPIIKRGILYQLINESWEKAISVADYSNLIGAFERAVGRLYSEGFWKFKMEILREAEKELSQVNWDKIYELSPPFRKPLNEILGNLRKNKLTPVLFFDIPYDVGQEYNTNYAHEELITSLVGETKTFHETLSIDRENMSEIYFLTGETLQAMETVFLKDYNPFRYEPYTPAEIFTILNCHYRPTGVPRGVENPLAVVFSGTFIDPPIWHTEKTLHKIITEVENLILESLDCPWPEVPYCLELKKEEQNKGKQ